MSITLVASKAILYSEEVYGRNLTLTSRTFAALVALSTFQKRMLLSILYLSNIISNMCYNVLVATLSLPQDKIIFPLDCRLLRKKHICILLTSLRNKFPLSVFTLLHGIFDPPGLHKYGYSCQRRREYPSKNETGSGSDLSSHIYES